MGSDETTGPSTQARARVLVTLQRSLSNEERASIEQEMRALGIELNEPQRIPGHLRGVLALDVDDAVAEPAPVSSAGNRQIQRVLDQVAALRGVDHVQLDERIQRIPR